MNTKTNHTLTNLGFDSFFAKKAEAFPHLYPSRVIAQARNLYRVVTEDGEIQAEISGKFRYETQDLTDFPVVGDFVLLDAVTDEQGPARIQQVLPRRTALVRRAAGTAKVRQMMAANVDKVFICMALNADFNLRRAERYLALVWDSGATPIFVLTKSDLCENLPEKMIQLQEIAFGVEILVTSALSEKGEQPLLDQVKSGETLAFVGSSGVGKSTLVNRLLGHEILKTDGLRNDDKGRHTTTQRELFQLENGAMVIDTPGMREIGLETAHLSVTFSDIDELAEACKFADCQHQSEPGCAVKAAVEQKNLAPDRLANYQKMKREAGYEGMNSRQIEQTKVEEWFREVGGMKNARKFLKANDKRRNQ